MKSKSQKKREELIKYLDEFEPMESKEKRDSTEILREIRDKR